jgi:hypothetical protein
MHWALIYCQVLKEDKDEIKIFSVFTGTNWKLMTEITRFITKPKTRLLLYQPRSQGLSFCPLGETLRLLHLLFGVLIEY